MIFWVVLSAGLLAVTIALAILLRVRLHRDVYCLYRVLEVIARNWPLPATFIGWGIVAGVSWKLLDPRSSSDLMTEWLKLVAQTGAAFFLAAGLIYTHRSSENARKVLDHQLSSGREEREDRRRSEQNERFFRAVEILGDRNRQGGHIGALFALEQLSIESETHYQQIVDVICDFIRQRSVENWPSTGVIDGLQAEYESMLDQPRDAWPKDDSGLPIHPEDRISFPDTSRDIQEAFRIIGRRRKRFGVDESRPLKLEGVNLSGMTIRNADLQGADLSGALLVGTQFMDCNLAHANMRRGDARFSGFSRTILCRTSLEKSKFHYARFYYRGWVVNPAAKVAVPFIKEGKTEWVVEGGDEIDAKVEASRYLDNSYWNGVEFKKTDFFQCPDLSGMSSLSRSQIREIMVGEDAVLPHDGISEVIDGPNGRQVIIEDLTDDDDWEELEL